MTTRHVSIAGTTNSAITIAAFTLGSLDAPSTAANDATSANPMNRDPASPRKIFAGGQLKSRNPANAPATPAASKACEPTCQWIAMATTASPVGIATAASAPSELSRRL